MWINRGREWATILKELTDSEFSPQYGINIQLSIMPASQMNSTTGSISPLLLAISAGNAPDVAMSVASNIPVEYAFRDAIVDLSAFPGFEEVKSRFLPQLMVPMEYGGKTYGLPEQMYFRGLFYRSDILEELGIPVPQTWKQVQEETLPKLYETAWKCMSRPGRICLFSARAAAITTRTAPVRRWIPRKRMRDSRRCAICIPSTACRRRRAL